MPMFCAGTWESKIGAGELCKVRDWPKCSCSGGVGGGLCV